MSIIFNKLDVVTTGKKPLQIITDPEFNRKKEKCCRCQKIKPLYSLPFNRDGKKFICSQCLNEFQQSRLPFLKLMPINLNAQV